MIRLLRRHTLFSRFAISPAAHSSAAAFFAAATLSLLPLFHFPAATAALMAAQCYHASPALFSLPIDCAMLISPPLMPLMPLLAPLLPLRHFRR